MRDPANTPHVDINDPATQAGIVCSALTLMEASHGLARQAGWWNDLHTGEPLYGKRNTSEMIMLAVSELSEANEAFRKGLQDDKLTHRPGIEVEFADAIIRIMDAACALGLDLPGALAEKMRYNASRSDHKPENRRKPNGKKF